MSKHANDLKTNAMRLLDQARIRYEVRHYAVDESDLSFDLRDFRRAYGPDPAAHNGMNPGEKAWYTRKFGGERTLSRCWFFQGLREQSGVPFSRDSRLLNEHKSYKMRSLCQIGRG